MLSRIGFALLVWASLPLASATPAQAAPEAATASLVALTRDLRFEVSEAGPDQLWTLQLSNLGEAPIELMADPGLLWFAVSVPGRSKPEICRLPEPLWPKVMRRRTRTTLRSGEVFSRRFDPRFFCFAELEQRLLVPGAKVTPYFGWPHDTQVVWNGGKRTVQTQTPRAPFVAWALPPLPADADGGEPDPAEQGLTESPDGEAPANDGASEPAPSHTPVEGLKLLQGATLALSAAYGAWSEREPQAKAKDLALIMLGGSDAEDERSVTATIGVINGSAVTRQIFLRRDLVDYEVVGPQGRFYCESSEVGSPDFASFSTLLPNKAEAMVVRLIEVCPRGAFSRAGLYEVQARLQAQWSGQALGLDAFTGRLETQRPALIRVRNGDRSAFLRSAGPMVAGEGGPGGALNADPSARPGAAPGAGTDNEVPLDQDAPPLDDAPADHEAPAGVEELPPPEAAPPPPEGTTVE